jgi:hypothetical protein
MLRIGKLSWLIKFTILVTIINCYSETFAKPVQWVKVPFTQLLPTGQPDSLEFNFSNNTFRYRDSHSQQTFAFEADEIPTLILPFKDGHVAFSRMFPSSSNKLNFYDKNGAKHQINVPPFMNEFIFMNAGILNNRIVALFYNVYTSRYNLATFVQTNSGIKWEAGFLKEIDFGDKHISNHSISIKVLKTKDRAYQYDILQFVSGNKIVNFHDKPYVFLSSDEIDKNLDFCGVISQEQKDVLVFKRLDLSQTKSGDYLAWYSNKDLASLPSTPALIKQNNLSNKELAATLRNSLVSFGSSGIVHLGLNNFEGLHNWSQVYYLNGLINLYSTFKKVDANLADEIRQRLNIEMHFIDRLMQDNNYNLYTKRYSLDRKKIRSAIHLARTVRLMRRYNELVYSPIHLKSYATLVQHLLHLNKYDYMDEIVYNGPNNTPGVSKDGYFLRIKKEQPFPHDGINCPHNYQTQYIGELAYQFTHSPIPNESTLILKSIYNIFMNNESKDGQLPKNHLWQYTWGKAKDGRTDSDNISLNTPHYPQNEYIADISYRTIDSMGIMATARILHLDSATQLYKYFIDGFKSGALWPFIVEELDQYDSKATGQAINDSEFLDYYFIPCAPYELQNASVAYRKKIAANSNEK